MTEFKVIKRYGYKQAFVNPKFIFPREIFKEIEENLIKQSNGIQDNHVVFLVESEAEGHTTQRIAFYFHDFGVMIGKEEDIILKSKI